MNELFGHHYIRTTGSSASTARDVGAVGARRRAKVAAAQRATGTWHASGGPGGHGGACRAQAAHAGLMDEIR